MWGKRENVKETFVLESSAVAALTPFWLVLAMLYKTKSEPVGEKKVYVFDPPTKSEVSFKMQLYEKKMRKPVFLLVSIRDVPTWVWWLGK